MLDVNLPHDGTKSFWSSNNTYLHGNRKQITVSGLYWWNSHQSVRHPVKERRGPLPSAVKSIGKMTVKDVFFQKHLPRAAFPYFGFLIGFCLLWFLHVVYTTHSNDWRRDRLGFSNVVLCIKGGLTDFRLHKAQNCRKPKGMGMKKEHLAITQMSKPSNLNYLNLTMAANNSGKLKAVENYLHIFLYSIGDIT